MTVYREIAIKINPVCADIVCDICNEKFTCEGIITAVEEFKKTKLVKAVYDVVKAYVTDENLDFDEVQTFFHQKRAEIADLKIFNEDIGTWDITITKQPNEDWSKKWKEHWKPTPITEHIVICPSWEKYEAKDGEKVIVLDPGNAFGTGTHATTRLCAQAIEKYVKNGDTVADVGCGSGILAMCAVKTGAKTVDAIDNDETATETAIENAEKNNLKIQFQTATIDVLSEKTYDFVAANILHNVLRDIMPDIKRILKIGGKAVLSGILDEKAEIVYDALIKNNLKILEKTQEKEWVAFVAERED
ncbi:MAG: 50S ribosomal protein L11 methyltransferase [Candidatus Gastranaerophilales bacterium]|nr:50S ribosomal protein L11 methyltransferase [Candidatus Gastranaerophilales bacterium]